MCALPPVTRTLPASFFSEEESPEIRSLKTNLLNIGMQDYNLSFMFNQFNHLEERVTINDIASIPKIKYITINDTCSHILKEIITQYPRGNEYHIRSLFADIAQRPSISAIDLIPAHQFLVAVSKNNNVEAIRLLELDPTLKDMTIHSIFRDCLCMDGVNLTNIFEETPENIDRMFRWSATPLTAALHCRNYELAHALLDRGCNVNAVGVKALGYLNHEPKDREALQCLRKMVNLRMEFNISPENPILHHMALLGNVTGIKILLNHFSNIIARKIHSVNSLLPLPISHIVSQYYGYSPLLEMRAMTSRYQIESSDHPDAIQPYLPDHVASDVCDLKGTTPLLAAAILCRFKTVRLLLEMGADVSAQVDNPSNSYHKWSVFDYANHPVRSLEIDPQSHKREEAFRNLEYVDYGDFMARSSILHVEFEKTRVILKSTRKNASRIIALSQVPKL